MSLRSRVEALAKWMPLPVGDYRVILCWKDDQGRLTKAADSHPELPDDQVYDFDIVSPHGREALQKFMEAGEAGS